MQTAKLIAIGGSQAVRLPEEFRFKGNEVFIKRVGSAVVLLPRDNSWDMLEGALRFFEPGLSIERNQPDHQARDDS